MAAQSDDSGPAIDEPPNANWVVVSPGLFPEITDDGWKREVLYQLANSSPARTAQPPPESEEWEKYIIPKANYFLITAKNEYFKQYIQPEMGRPLIKNNNVKAVFFPLSEYNDLRVGWGSDFPWGTDEEKLNPKILVRDIDGTPKFINLNPPYGKNPPKTIIDFGDDWWEQMLYSSFPTNSENQLSWARSINPPIALVLRLLPGGRYTSAQFAAAINEVTKPGTKCRQTVTIEPWNHNPTIQDYHLLSVSPYTDYEVWIPDTSLSSYLQARPDRPLPTAEQLITAKDKLKINAFKELSSSSAEKGTLKQEQEAAQKEAPGVTYQPGSIIVKEVSAELMASKINRDEAVSQIKVMGISATDVAKIFQWKPQPGGKIPAVGDWQGGNSPSEWLHKVGYAYGIKGQLTGNLIFGSSETNSLMTRYEAAFQQYLNTEVQFRQQFKDVLDPPARRETPKQSKKLANALLGIRELKEGPILTRVLKQSPTLQITDTEVVPAPPDPTLYWLWYGLKYSFKAGPDVSSSALSGPAGTFQTTFFNFQRPFLTVLEVSLDNALRKALYDAKSAPFLKAQGDAMQGVEEHLAFVSTPTNRRRPDDLRAFNFNALTSSLLSIGTDVPATVTHSAAAGFVTSTAPQSLPHAQIWSQALAGGSVTVDGAEIHQPSFVSLDTDGRLVSVPAAQLISDDVAPTRIPDADAPRHISRRAVDTTTSPFEVVNGLPGIRQVTRLVQSSGPQQSTPPGFVLTGDLQLFGSIPAKLYTFQGTSAGAGIREIVTVPANLSMKNLFSELNEDLFDTIGLENVQLEYQDTPGSDGKAPGLWLEADIAFKGALQPVGDILKTFFGQEQPNMQFGALLGSGRDWQGFQLPTGFSMTGTFNNTNFSLASFITFTTVGVHLTVDMRLQTYPTAKYFHEFGYGFFGTCHIALPGSTTPLNATFTLQKTGTLYYLSLTLSDDAWEDVFGIHGLTLTAVQLSAQFDESKISDTIVFDFSALMNRGGSGGSGGSGDDSDDSDDSDETIQLSGYFTKGDWNLSAEIDNVDLPSISQMFAKVFGGSLPSFDIHMDTLTLTVDPTGISLTGQVTVNDYTAAEATFEINESGINISGSVGDVTIDNLTIKNASLEVFIAPTIPSKTQIPVHFGINGVVDFGGLEISSTLYISKSPDEALQWTAYGEYDVATSSASLAPSLKGTFLDLPMKQIALIAGNTDHPAEGFTNKYNYPIIKGISLCAEVSSIDALNKITRVNMDGLILRVSAIEGQGFGFGIILPMDKAISFGPNITSTPISLSLDISEPPSLEISAGLNITVAKQAQPLVFTMTLMASPVDASATAELKGYWVNPLGISPNVKIGPDMALQLGITYATFFTTGTPSRLAISGGLAIGKTTAQVALSVGTDPTQELISVTLAELTLGDMVSFASDIVGKPIPLPDESMLHFEQVGLTISTGVSIGSTFYPPGASFVGNMELFGKTASMSATIHDGIQIAGSFQGFSLGPLAITGATTPNAQVQLEITPSTQRFLIDGGTKLLVAAASIHLEAELLPTPNFNFTLTLAFTELLPFTVNGKMLGAVDVQHLDALDFQLDALLEQKILTYLISQANMQLVTAQKAAKEGFDNTQQSLNQAEASFQQSVTKAQADLTRTQAAWTAKSASAQKAIDQVNQSTQDGQKKLQAQIQQATAAWTAKVNVAQQALDQQKAKSAAAIQSAQAGVTKATADSAAAIDTQKKSLAAAQQSMNSKFGNAIQSVKNAQASVQNAQNDFNAANAAVTHAQSDLDHGSFLQRAALAAKLAAAESVKTSKQAALTTAQATLNAAQAVLNGAGYQAAQATLNTYQASLQAAENAAPAAIAAANATAQATITAQNAAISAAQATLDQTKTSSAEALAVKSANASLDAFMKTQNQLLATANASLTALNSSAEYVAFTSAQSALKFANSNTQDLDVARQAFNVAQASENAALAATQWMVNHAGNFLNLTSVELTGTLKGLCDNGEPMKAHIIGMVADKSVNVVLDYNIGKTPDLIKDLFTHLWGMLTGVPQAVLPIR